MQLEATNFQAWPRFELVVEGLTVIVGDSNLGKSAVFRALRGVLRNDVGAARVKIGADVCTVSCIYEGVDTKITRPRKGSVTYTVNGTDYSRLAKEVPKEVRALNFEPVEIGTVKLDPIFAGQFGSQFLLEASPAELGQVLGAFASTEKLERGRKLLRQMTTDVDKEATTLAGIIGRAQDEAAAVEIKVDSVRKIEDAVDLMDATISTKMPVCELLTTIIDAGEELKRLKPLTTIKIPTLDRSRTLLRAAASADDAAISSQKSKRLHLCLEKIDELRVVQARAQAVDKTLMAVDSLLNCEDVDVTGLKTILDNHLAPKAKALKLSRAVATIGWALEHHGAQVPLKRHVEEIDEELETISSEKEQIQKDKAAAAIAEQQVTCPECGATFVPE